MNFLGMRSALRSAAPVMLLCAIFLLGNATFAQDANAVSKMATLKLSPLPVLPSCMTIAPTHGDPFKGAATIAIKMKTGCTVPWHWHSASESLIIVSGKGKVEMKDHNMSETLGPGDTVFLAEKHHHQFTCMAYCIFYDITEGAFDIHYVDAEGKEIKPEEALTTSSAPANSAKPKAATK